MKQADVVSNVANEMLTIKKDVIDGRVVVIRYDPTSDHFTRNIMALIEKEYRMHGKTFRGDPTSMINKVSKIVRANAKTK